MELAHFTAWLSETGRSPATADTYRRSVSAVLGKMEEPPYDVQVLRDHTEGLSKSSRKLFLASWRAFQAFWAASTADCESPPPLPPEPVAPPVELSEVVAYAIYVLTTVAEVSFAHLAKMRWHHVDRSPQGQYRIAVPRGKPGQAYPCLGEARDALLTLREWSYDPDRPSAPLVPAWEGSDETRSAKQLRTDISRVKREERKIALAKREPTVAQVPSELPPLPVVDESEAPVDLGPPSDDEELESAGA